MNHQVEPEDTSGLDQPTPKRGRKTPASSTPAAFSEQLAGIDQRLQSIQGLIRDSNLRLGCITVLLALVLALVVLWWLIGF